MCRIVDACVVFIAGPRASARLVTGSLVEITNPEVPQAFYSELKGRRPLQNGERPADRITTQLAEMARRPALIRSFFRYPSIAYISACCINGWIANEEFCNGQLCVSRGIIPHIMSLSNIHHKISTININITKHLPICRFSALLLLLLGVQITRLIHDFGQKKGIEAASEFQR